MKFPPGLVSWLMIPRCYVVKAGDPALGVPRVGTEVGSQGVMGAAVGLVSSQLVTQGIRTRGHISATSKDRGCVGLVPWCNK